LIIMPRRRFPIGLLVLATTMGGCQGAQSALNPYGPEARELEWLFWFFLAVLSAVWIAVVVALILALIRRRSQVPERSMTRVIGALVGTTAIVLLVLTGLSYRAQSRLYGHQQTTDLITIHVTGHQWWWEIEYDSSDQSQTFSTANEIHIPLNRQIRMKLTSADVIHSFWVPTVFGKMDLITGVENEIRFTVDKPGVLRGQCAEFCGIQHAHMSLLLVAEDLRTFKQWRSSQLNSRRPPASPEGEKIFLSKPCAICHTIRGTPAGGRFGPDLTHFGSRKTIAAGTLPLTRGAIAGWIVDPQSTKPGANMPAVDLTPRDLLALTDYLEGLR
jgi:cytochrome c oxidase subunit II